MRVRKQPDSWDRMMQRPDVFIPDPSSYRGRWKEAFFPASEVWLELGCGRGQFCRQLAKAHPDVLIVALDRVPEVVVSAVQRMEPDTPNARYLCWNVDFLDEAFAPGEVDRLFLHFSDPWPKNKHAKRRMTHANYLRRYAALMKPGALLSFRTDSKVFYDFTLEQLAAAGMDYTETPLNPEAHSEYEDRFLAGRCPVYACQARFDGTRSL